MRIPATALLATLALAACSREPAPDAQPTGTATFAGKAAAAGSTAAPPAPQTPATGTDSFYTALTTCHEIEHVDEGSYARSLCPAPGSLTLELVTSDGRDDLRIGNSPKGAINLELPTLGKGAFNAVGPAVEWRGSSGPGGFVPEALIVRNRIYDTPDHPERARSTLVVADITKRCVVAEIPAGPDQNDAARRAATEGRGCLTLR